MSERYAENICALVHGEPGVGKSWFGQTTPAPRLVLDAEGGSRHPRRMTRDGKVVRVPKVIWDPTRDAPPEYDGTWESCHVFVRNYNIFERAYGWLNIHDHPFRSVVIDSLTEVQKRCKDAISAGETPSERQWGELLIKMELKVREFRDLMFHPTNPLDAVCILALTDPRGRKAKPAVQGALGLSLPGYVDLEGYLGAFPRDDGDGLERRMLIQPLPEYEAKDRTHTLSQHWGMSIPNPDFTEMLEVYNSEESE